MFWFLGIINSSEHENRIVDMPFGHTVDSSVLSMALDLAMVHIFASENFLSFFLSLAKSPSEIQLVWQQEIRSASRLLLMEYLNAVSKQIG